MEMRKILMVDPKYFDVVYAINAHMTSADGQLNKVDKTLAKSQWQTLKSTYENLGFQVEVLPPVDGLPDMVFSANQSLPFWNDRTGRPAVILSKMRSEFRKNEVSSFEKYYQNANYEIHHLKSNLALEGNGDALLQGKTLWAGYGFRTDKSVYEEVQMITGFEVLPLELNNEYFYHLDTCFSILDEKTVAVVREAFLPRDFQTIQSRFKTVIEIDWMEAKDLFAGNCHSPDGRHVILHPGSQKFCNDLRKHGFEPLEINTSEYMKSGGSVFCMKMMHY